MAGAHVECQKYLQIVSLSMENQFHVQSMDFVHPTVWFYFRKTTTRHSKCHVIIMNFWFFLLSSSIIWIVISLCVHVYLYVYVSLVVLFLFSLSFDTSIVSRTAKLHVRMRRNLTYWQAAPIFRCMRKCVFVFVPVAVHITSIQRTHHNGIGVLKLYHRMWYDMIWCNGRGIGFSSTFSTQTEYSNLLPYARIEIYLVENTNNALINVINTKLGMNNRNHMICYSLPFIL